MHAEVGFRTAPRDTADSLDGVGGGFVPAPAYCDPGGSVRPGITGATSGCKDGVQILRIAPIRPQMRRPRSGGFARSICHAGASAVLRAGIPSASREDGTLRDAVTLYAGVPPTPDAPFSGSSRVVARTVTGVIPRDKTTRREHLGAGPVTDGTGAPTVAIDRVVIACTCPRAISWLTGGSGSVCVINGGRCPVARTNALPSRVSFFVLCTDKGYGSAATERCHASSATFAVGAGGFCGGPRPPLRYQRRHHFLRSQIVCLLIVTLLARTDLGRCAGVVATARSRPDSLRHHFGGPG